MAHHQLFASCGLCSQLFDDDDVDRCYVAFVDFRQPSNVVTCVLGNIHPIE